ncbi:MAG: OmpA family protein [Flavobacteriales bacterium]
MLRSLIAMTASPPYAPQRYRCTLRRCTAVLALLLIAPTLFAQELVVNGGFEEQRGCPERRDKHPLKQARAVTGIGGMPGYFHSCSEDLGAPGNWAGWQAPQEGLGYAGIVLTAHGGGECRSREWLQLPLARPLVNGGKYRLRFWVSLADRSGYVTDRIGAAFSTDDRKRTGVGAFIGRAAVDNPLDRFLADTAGWMLVEGVYNARGGERFVLIGNLQACDRTSRKALASNAGDGVLKNLKKRGAVDLDPDQGRALRRRLLATQSYVYVDGVSLMPLLEADAEAGPAVAQGCTDDPGAPDAGQDLVPDPGFDNSVGGRPEGWSNASGGTPDLLAGQCGIYLYSAVNRDHREFIHIPLKQPLDPCGRYALRMRVRRDASYGYAVDRIGVALCDSHAVDRRREVLPLVPQWTSARGPVLDGTTEWTTLCGTFDAPGCSRSLVVGNFLPDDSTVVVQRDVHGGPFAYYFVDDVSVWRVGTVPGCTKVCCPAEQPSAARSDGLEAGSMAVERGPSLVEEQVLTIHFDVNEHLPDARVLELVEHVRRALEADPQAGIELTGHTDNSGSEDHNEQLALMRAQAVADALLLFGAPRCRTEVMGAGSREPVADNASVEGRALNRRVELRIIASH